MGFPTLVRRHLYIESGPCSLGTWNFPGEIDQCVKPWELNWATILSHWVAKCSKAELLTYIFVFHDDWSNLPNVGPEVGNWLRWWLDTYVVPGQHLRQSQLVITRVSEVIMFSPCVFVTLFVCLFVSLSRCLSGQFNYEGLVPHKQYFAGTLLGMSSCASYVSRTHDVIDDVTRSQSRSNFESDISPSKFELERRSKAQNVGNAHGYLVYSTSGITSGKKVCR